MATAVLGTRWNQLSDRHTKLMGKINLFESNEAQLQKFLETFSTPAAINPHSPWNRLKYRQILQSIHDRKTRMLQISLDDLEAYFTNDETGGGAILEDITANTHRYLHMLYEAADKSLLSGEYEMSRTEEINHNEMVISDADIQRYIDMSNGNIPAYLRVNFQIIIHPGNRLPSKVMRAVAADCIGGLSKFEADVVRLTLVKPRLQVATYECQRCHQYTYMAIEGLHFMPLQDCPSCKESYNVSSTLKFNLKKSKFTQFQEMKVQEAGWQVPEGDVPRSLNCVVLGAHCKKLQPGMHVSLTGTLLPVSKFGFAGMISGLVAEKYFEICFSELSKKEFDKEDEDYVKIHHEIDRLKQEDGLYDKLAYSIAPEIWGWEDVKKGLLLQLIGGCSKEKNDGGTIRGDIHILLMGDPGVAKSQLMKKVCSIAQRSIYTTGKGSSSVGLTAAVIKDPNTGETTLEGGALVLADQGICCIDEFDKMDDYDRSAIYEVMEQQSVSIAKAGHCSTMPARTAVLAGANPAGGRYDPRRSVMANMNLPAALLTRFDLQFLLLDAPDREKDIKLAQHVLDVYRSTENSNWSKREYVDRKVLCAFASLAKQRTPVLAKGLLSQVADWYVSARKAEFSKSSVDRMTYTTPRALLAVFRLSQALARLRDSNTIELGDFEEAIRLTDESKRSLREQHTMTKKRQASPRIKIMELITRMKERYASRSKWNGWLALRDIQQQVLAVGLKLSDLEEALKTYVELAVLVLNDDQTEVAFPEDIRDAEDDVEML